MSDSCPELKLSSSSELGCCLSSLSSLLGAAMISINFLTIFF